MKKLIIAIAATVTFAGCTTERIVVQQPEATTTLPPLPSTAPQSAEDIYIDAIIAEYPSVVNSLGRSFWIEFGDTVCSEIDNGMTLEQLAILSVEYDVDAAMLGFVTAAAIIAFCPHNQWFIDAATGA